MISGVDAQGSLYGLKRTQQYPLYVLTDWTSVEIVMGDTCGWKVHRAGSAVTSSSEQLFQEL